MQLQLQEIGVGAINKSARTRAIAIRVADWLAASLPLHPDEGGAGAPQSAYTGDVLAALGDRRFDRERFYLPSDDLLGFVHISADPDFTIGTRKADAARITKITHIMCPDSEINDDLTPAPEFYIARYPVTVGQFKAFVDATGFSLGVGAGLREPNNRPIHWVSWHEALAYCEWLNEMFATSPALESSPIARLVRESGWRADPPQPFCPRCCNIGFAEIAKQSRFLPKSGGLSDEATEPA